MKVNTLFIALLVPCFAFAQQDSTLTTKPQDTTTNKQEQKSSNKEKYIHKKNNIKVNLSGFAFNNYNITYERALSNHFSISLGYNYIPNGTFPFLDQLKNNINDANTAIGNVTLGGYAITPEVRWYAGKGLRGFYVAPYVRMSSFDVVFPGSYTITYNAPITNTPTTQTFNVTFSGTMKATSAGMMFGIQERLGSSMTLDIWLIGGSYSGTTNRLNGIINPPLPNADAQAQMENKLNSINAGPYQITGKVPTLSTAYVDITNWYGIRGLGITLGVKF